MNIVVSVFLKTESSDEYHYLFTDISNSDDLIERLEGMLGDELAYVWSVDIATDCCLDEDFEQAVYARIREMEEE
ncbi:hypothetical protein [Pseudomonas phage vB_PseuGesM_254]|uniref:Uncharacterized protein n=1 Tax=Pseudomonas phage vB_PseuGesM_254 TaxID=3092638 RepID=A0AAX4G6D1_9CAUD|nr:hypothetical protein [Pseudomonas phage PseuGes_254]